MKQLIPFLFLFLFSCKEKLPPVPGDVIAFEKMKLIMTDIHISDAVAETNAQKGEDERAQVQHNNEQIFRNHGISKDEFLKSFQFYESNPALLNKMYDEILNELSKREEAEGKSDSKK
ncbi:MAG: DUF4296 domain-containing protein [Bacteroidota bacterium]